VGPKEVAPGLSPISHLEPEEAALVEPELPAEITQPGPGPAAARPRPGRPTSPPWPQPARPTGSPWQPLGATTTPPSTPPMDPDQHPGTGTALPAGPLPCRRGDARTRRTSGTGAADGATPPGSLRTPATAAGRRAGRAGAHEPGSRRPACRRTLRLGPETANRHRSRGLRPPPGVTLAGRHGPPSPRPAGPRSRAR
jgi:hypothetical protein